MIMGGYDTSHATDKKVGCGLLTLILEGRYQLFSGPITGKVVGTTAAVGAVGPLSINNSRPADTWNPSQNTVESKHQASPCQRVF